MNRSGVGELNWFNGASVFMPRVVAHDQDSACMFNRIAIAGSDRLQGFARRQKTPPAHTPAGFTGSG